MKEVSVFMFVEVRYPKRNFWENTKRKIRVAAYCRVSTIIDEQLES